MKKLTAILSMIAFCFAMPAFSAERGTVEEAKALAEKAAVFFKENGVDASRVAFDDPKGSWIDRDLYVFVYKVDGTNVIFGSKPQLEGKNLIDLKDADGKDLIKAIVAVNGSDWVNYKWLNPVNNKIEDKASWCIRIDDYVLGVGAYK